MTLAYIAGVLQKNHILKVLDCIALEMPAGGVFTILEEFSPELVLINTTTPSINSDINFIQTLKEKFPACFVAVFGTHVTVIHESIMQQCASIDCVIRNEPEWTVLDLVKFLQDKNTKLPVLGATLRINGKVIVYPAREFNEDLDSLGYPAWDYFDLTKYIHPVFNKPYLMVNTSRGCGHSCIFCVASIFYGKKVRYRTVESILDEIEYYLIGKLGIRHIWMYADDFTRSHEFVKKLCQGIINRKLKIIWWTNTRVDNNDSEMFQLMKKAGCYMLSIGGESANSEILKIIKKGTRPELIEKTVKILRQTGINSLVYFLIGLPGETRDTIRETLDFCKKINPDYVEFYPATPYPGTEFFDIAIKQNLMVSNNWDDFFCGGSEFVVEIPGIKKDELDKILRKSYKEYYFRFKYFILFVKRITQPLEFFRLLSFGLGYFKRFVTD
ncbi:MAG: radical SAM protein [Candidatus Omnitrophota bacterium]|jgi:radical SAM superfamily enzyme YgiQ (UPF0313 family)